MKLPDKDINVPSKQHEEIKKGLKPCENASVFCEFCACEFRCKIEADALTYIQQLESRLAQVEKERDAAVEAVEMYPCFTCKNISSTYCKDCLRNRSLALDRAGEFLPDNYEWRGFCAENTKEDANA